MYRALGYMAATLVEAGVPVLIDATAHRRAWRDPARAAIPRFAEVQLVCPLDVCRERERIRAPGHAPRDIYRQAGRPGATVPGVDVPYEPALAAELTIDTTAVDDVATGRSALVGELARPPGRGGAVEGVGWATGSPAGRAAARARSPSG